MATIFRAENTVRVAMPDGTTQEVQRPAGRAYKVALVSSRGPGGTWTLISLHKSHEAAFPKARRMRYALGVTDEQVRIVKVLTPVNS